MTEFSANKPVPVRIGVLVLYCEKFSASGSRVFSEKATVNGDTFISNSCRKALKITFSGRVYDDYYPLRPMMYSVGFMDADTEFEIKYRGTVFYGCRVQSFNAEENDEGGLNISISLVTSSAMGYEPLDTAEVRQNGD